MVRRTLAIAVLLGLVWMCGCTNKKVSNPLSNVSSAQPDKVLFDRAMDDMKHNRYDQSRLALETLINTYPDSEFIARAKLAMADSWYAEGGSTSLAQAEIQYKDFETFFPNMPEAAEAQLKIANIHYQQMEKPDRDYTHAVRAEEEYRQRIMQYPDSKLVPEAKQKLREVQEVIAEREFGVGRFYYLRQSYPAAIARLRSLVDKYPLYSQADEALYLLGQSYEGEITMVRANRKIPEDLKARMIAEFTKGAAEAYDRILTRYPVMDRVDDAKARLQALHQPVLRPTKAAVAQNKAEEDSRRETTTLSRVLRTFAKHPRVAEASKVGEPTLVDPTPVSASEVVQSAAAAAVAAGGAGNHSVSIEAVGVGAPPPSQPAPRSDTPATTESGGAGQPAAAAQTPATDTSENPAATTSDPSELKPNVAPDPNELKPNVTDDNGAALPPPQQVNEIQAGANGQAAAAAPGQPAAGASGQAATNNGQTSDTASSTSQQASDDDQTTEASSRHKKKKGIHKVVPF